MGLFDIFKRRNKKEQEKPAEKPEVEVDNVDDSEVLSSESTSTSEASKVTSEDTSQATEAESTSETKKSEVASEKAAEDVNSQEPTSQTVVESTEANSEAKLVPKSLTVDSQTSNQAEETVSEVKEDDGSQAITNVASEAEVQLPVEDSEAVEAEGSETVGDKTKEPEAPKSVEESTASETPAVKNDDDIYERGLARSRSTFGQKLNALFANFRSVDESFFTNLEDMLIESDVGFETAMQITDELRDEVKLKNVKKTKEVQNVVIKKMIDIYDAAGDNESIEINFADQGPTVILFVGVNGVGKTTTIGKMAQMYKDQGRKVLLAAADTFRAGAIAQLNVWAERDGVDIVKGKEQGDPAAVVYDAVKKAKAENYDILMVDTAGRLQNKVNLMNELAKMKKVITREIPDAPHETLLVLDGTTGQNALNQAKMFKDTTDVSGIVLTKLDGTAKGGIVFAIRNELHLPVKYVGLGEKVTDLQVFDANEFVYGLFKGLIS
ncbi:signal recognition particle-docking protein FtsY [Lentilactobacillus senioris]|uniref:signal recognition particle-docking protein FtsY n=1 Tax=Lentilactobacillus senioris TaxID=931534 RepID=UPI00227F8466|nr:signal recognition particle-docking protein FtsY [Lentilactobacillus senioris]MCY9806883.1 signal recognition particle-docking protein FtsY [Lentilactobacillus senioris]